MIRTQKLIAWLEALPADSRVAIDDTGQLLQAVSPQGVPLQGKAIEVGFVGGPEVGGDL